MIVDNTNAIDGELQRLGHAALGFVVELDTVFISHHVKRPCLSTLGVVRD